MSNTAGFNARITAKKSAILVIMVLAATMALGATSEDPTGSDDLHVRPENPALDDYFPQGKEMYVNPQAHPQEQDTVNPEGQDAYDGKDTDLVVTETEFEEIMAPDPSDIVPEGSKTALPAPTDKVQEGKQRNKKAFKDVFAATRSKTACGSCQSFLQAVDQGKKDNELCPESTTNHDMCKLWLTDKKRMQEYIKTGFDHEGICKHVGFCGNPDRCSACQDNMYGIGLLAEQGKKEEAMKVLTTTTGNVCKGDTGVGMCSLNNLRAVSFSLAKRAASVVKKMSAQKWAGTACKIMEQCKTSAEHVWNTNRKDVPLPVLSATKCVTHKYKYSQDVLIAMGQAVRSAETVTKQHNNQKNLVHADVEVTGHGKTKQGLNIYSLSVQNGRIKAAAANDKYTERHPAVDEAFAVDKGYFLFTVKPSGSLGKLFYSRHYDLSSVDFKRKIASEFMHSLRHPQHNKLNKPSVHEYSLMETDIDGLDYHSSYRVERRKDMSLVVDRTRAPRSASKKMPHLKLRSSHLHSEFSKDGTLLHKRESNHVSGGKMNAEELSRDKAGGLSGMTLSTRANTGLKLQSSHSNTCGKLSVTHSGSEMEVLLDGSKLALQDGEFTTEYKARKPVYNRAISRAEVKAQRTEYHDSLESAMLDTAAGLNQCPNTPGCDKHQRKNLIRHMKRHVKADKSGGSTQFLGDMIMQGVVRDPTDGLQLAQIIAARDDPVSQRVTLDLMQSDWLPRSSEHHFMTPMMMHKRPLKKTLDKFLQIEKHVSKHADGRTLHSVLGAMVSKAPKACLRRARVASLLLQRAQQAEKRGDNDGLIAAMNGMGNMGPTRRHLDGVLKKGLQHEDYEVRTHAVMAMRKSADVSGIELMQVFLDDKDDMVRKSALDALKARAKKDPIESRRSFSWMLDQLLNHPEHSKARRTEETNRRVLKHAAEVHKMIPPMQLFASYELVSDAEGGQSFSNKQNYEGSDPGTICDAMEEGGGAGFCKGERKSQTWGAKGVAECGFYSEYMAMVDLWRLDKEGCGDNYCPWSAHFYFEVGTLVGIMGNMFKVVGFGSELKRTSYGENVNPKAPVRSYLMLMNHQFYIDAKDGSDSTGAWGGITVEPCGTVAPIPIFPPTDSRMTTSDLKQGIKVALKMAKEKEDETKEFKIEAVVEAGIATLAAWMSFKYTEAAVEFGVKLTLIKVVSVTLSVSYGLGLSAIIEPCGNNYRSIVVGFDPYFGIGATVEGGIDILDGIIGAGVGMDLNFFELHIPLSATFNMDMFKFESCPTPQMNVAFGTNVYVLSGRFYVYFQLIKIIKITPVEICWPTKNAFYQSTDPETMKPGKLAMESFVSAGVTEEENQCDTLPAPSLDAAALQFYQPKLDAGADNLLQDKTWAHDDIAKVSGMKTLARALARNTIVDTERKASRSSFRDLASHYFLIENEEDARMDILRAMKKANTLPEVFQAMLDAVQSPRAPAYDNWRKFAALVQEDRDFTFPVPTRAVRSYLRELAGLPVQDEKHDDLMAVGEEDEEEKAELIEADDTDADTVSVQGSERREKRRAERKQKRQDRRTKRQANREKRQKRRQAFFNKIKDWTKKAVSKLKDWAVAVANKFKEWAAAMVSAIKTAWSKIASFFLNFFGPCSKGAGWIFAGEYTVAFQPFCYAKGISDATRGVAGPTSGYRDEFKKRFGHQTALGMLTTCTARNCATNARVFAWGTNGAKCLPDNPCGTDNTPCSGKGSDPKCSNSAKYPWYTPQWSCGSCSNKWDFFSTEPSECTVTCTDMEQNCITQETSCTDECAEEDPGPCEEKTKCDESTQCDSLLISKETIFYPKSHPKGKSIIDLKTGDETVLVSMYGPADYLGCFLDNSSRDLQYGPKNYGYTASSCMAACTQYKYIALQNGGWCNCDNTYGTPSSTYTKQPDNQCNKGFTGGGGSWRNAVYTNVKSPQNAVNTKDFLGCYLDNSSRDLKYGPKAYGYTPATCMDACNEYKYIGLQNGGWCNCDNTYSSPSSTYTKQPDNQCNKGFTGGGGGWKNAIYSNTKMVFHHKVFMAGMVVTLEGGNKDDPDQGVDMEPDATVKKHCADEGNSIKCNRGGIDKWERFSIKDAGDGKFALIGGQNSKYCADEGAGGIKCNRDAIGQWEKFTVSNSLDGTIALKGGKDGKYCADENELIKCDRNTIGDWERFIVKDARPMKPGTVVALEGGNDSLYCADEGDKIKCDRNSIGQWEKFTVVDGGGILLGLKGGKNNKYCSDEGNNVICNRNHLAAWEKFRVDMGSDDEVALRGGQTGKYCADEGNKIICNRDHKSTWETFIVHEESGFGSNIDDSNPDSDAKQCQKEKECDSSCTEDEDKMDYPESTDALTGKPNPDPKDVQCTPKCNTEKICTCRCTKQVKLCQCPAKKMCADYGTQFKCGEVTPCVSSSPFPGPLAKKVENGDSKPMKDELFKYDDSKASPDLPYQAPGDIEQPVWSDQPFEQPTFGPPPPTPAASHPTGPTGATGSFSVTNKNIANFASWAASGGAQLLATDFNGDGKTDVAIVGPSGWTTIPVAFSNGDGTFSVTNNGVASLPGWASSPGVQCVAGDFNADGKGDIGCTGGSGWGSLPVAFGKGDGHFDVVNKNIANFASWAGSGGAQLAVADVDGDGKDDVLIQGPSGWTTIPVAFSKGDGTFKVTNEKAADFPSWASSSGAQVITGDFNGDGRGDVAIDGPSGWSTLPVAFSTSAKAIVLEETSLLKKKQPSLKTQSTEAASIAVNKGQLATAAMPPKPHKSNVAAEKHANHLKKKFAMTHAQLQKVEADMLKQVKTWASTSLEKAKALLDQNLEKMNAQMKAAGVTKDTTKKCHADQDDAKKELALSTMLEELTRGPKVQNEAEYFRASLKVTHNKLINAVRDAYDKMSNKIAKGCRRVCNELAANGVSDAGMNRWKALMNKFRVLKRGVSNDMPGDKPVALVAAARQPANLPSPKIQLESTQKWLEKKLAMLGQQIEWVTKAAVLNLETTMEEEAEAHTKKA
jgi:hypothetical protein